MSSFLRVLMIEDDTIYAQRLLHELQGAGQDVDYRCVDSQAAMATALSHNSWDIILCDENLQHFSVVEALATLRESGRTLPIFLRSGTIGAETAVTILQAVAYDFIVKESYAQLVPTLAQELRAIRMRPAQKETASEYQRGRIARCVAFNILIPNSSLLLSSNSIQ